MVAELDLLPFEEYVRSLNKKRMSAGALFYDDTKTHVLLVELSYVTHWGIPGGTVDAGEAPWTTAAREVHEEVGIDRPLGRLLVIDYISANAQMPEGLAFVFDGGPISETEVRALTITDPEIVSVGLCPLDEIADKVSAGLARRVTVAVAMLGTDKLALVEDGRFGAS